MYDDDTQRKSETTRKQHKKIIGWQRLLFYSFPFISFCIKKKKKEKRESDGRRVVMFEEWIGSSGWMEMIDVG